MKRINELVVFLSVLAALFVLIFPPLWDRENWHRLGFELPPLVQLLTSNGARIIYGCIITYILVRIFLDSMNNKFRILNESIEAQNLKIESIRNETVKPVMQASTINIVNQNGPQGKTGYGGISYTIPVDMFVKRSSL